MLTQPVPWSSAPMLVEAGRRPGGADPMKLLGIAMVLLSGAITVAGWLFFFTCLTSL